MTEALRGLAELARLETERDGLALQIEVAERHLAEAESRHHEATLKLASEAADVARLESFSMIRIMAGLRGTRDAELSREQAEKLAAQFAVEEADKRWRAAQRELDARRQRLEELSDLESRRSALLAAREREMAADPASAPVLERLTEIAGRQGVLDAEAVQLKEAVVAAGQARQALRDASGLLNDAHGWATYDTFFGGGLVGDLVKHDKLGRAEHLMSEADAALAHLATELADVNIEAVGSVGLTQLARTFDIWFDNIFSDYNVRGRIRDAATRVDGLLRDVDAVVDVLTQRLGGVESAMSDLEATRRGLLTGEPA